MGHPSASGSLHSAGATETHHQVPKWTIMFVLLFTCVQSHPLTVFLLCFFKIRILWMVPIYSLDSVSRAFHSEKYPTFAADIKKLSWKRSAVTFPFPSIPTGSGSPWNTPALPFTWTRAESVTKPTSSTTSWPSCSTSWKTSIPAWWWCWRSRSSRNTCLLSAAAPRGRWESELLLQWTDSSKNLLVQGFLAISLRSALLTAVLIWCQMFTDFPKLVLPLLGL